MVWRERDLWGPLLIVALCVVAAVRLWVTR